MIIPRGFYYEGQLPFLGDKAYFVVRYLPMRMYARAFPDGARALNWACLNNLFVHPRYRNRGHGRQLLGMLKAWQQATQTNILFLCAPYQRRAGCGIDCLHTFYVGEGFPHIVGTPYHYRLCE